MRHRTGVQVIQPLRAASGMARLPTPHALAQSQLEAQRPPCPAPARSSDPAPGRRSPGREFKHCAEPPPTPDHCAGLGCTR